MSGITAIIGGGAAGLAAACMLVLKGGRVILLEKQARVGRKLLSTGNGRCNLSNLNASEKYYRGDARYIRAAIAAFSPEDVCDFFESIGLICTADEEGRLYPLSNQAAGVLDALRLCAVERGCDIRTDFAVSRVTRQRSGFIIEAASGERLRADQVIVACGGLAAPKLGGCGDGYKILESFGHRTSPRLPAIAAIRTDPDAVRALKGIRMHGQIALIADEKCLRRETGEILFGDGSVSGIAAMQLARQLNLELQKGRGCSLRLNFLPDASVNMIDRRAALLPDRSMDDFLSGIVPKRLGQVICKAAGIAPLSLAARELNPGQRRALFNALTGWLLPARGSLGFDQAQVTCGGTELRDFDPETLQSRLVPGLYAAGEVLDVDGDCGGFNLHWAWASAALCARSILLRD